LRKMYLMKNDKYQLYELEWKWGDELYFSVNTVTLPNTCGLDFSARSGKDHVIIILIPFLYPFSIGINLILHCLLLMYSKEESIECLKLANPEFCMSIAKSCGAGG
jgi:hypothetical protein